MQGTGKRILIDKIGELRIHSSRRSAGSQILSRRNAVNTQHLESLHEPEGVQHVGHRIFGAHSRPEQRSGILEVRKLIQHIVVVRLIFLRNENRDQVFTLGMHDLPERLPAAADVRSAPLVDHGEATVGIIAETADLLKELLGGRRKLPDLLLVRLVPLLYSFFFPFGPGVIVECHI